MKEVQALLCEFDRVKARIKAAGKQLELVLPVIEV